MKNVAASVKARLLNVARKEARDFNRVLLLYMQERFLARLAASNYQDRFILKGGVFLYLRYGSRARPTVDLDLLGRALAPDLGRIAAIMREVTSLNLADGVRFDPESVSATRIREEAIYEGVRVKLNAYLESARVPLQIDVAFGDLLTSKPGALSYPTLLGDAQLPAVLTYAIETVVAEKFQAMVVLGTLNSRFKDFYDLYVISQRERLEAGALTAALGGTFARRETPLADAPYLFKRTFAATPALRQGWARLRTANPRLDAPEDFTLVMERLSRFLGPVVRGVASGTWQPEQAAWSGSSPSDR